MFGYEEFKKETRKRVEQLMGEGYRVEINSIRKQNTGVQDAMAVFDKESTRNCISPNIYLEPFYQEYKKGMRMQEVAEEIAAIYHRESTGAKAAMESMPDIGDYESCRGRLYFRLAGTERNRHLLGEVPHCEVMDLSAIPYLLIKETQDGMSSIMVKNGMVKSWGVPAGDVLKQAFANTPKIMPAITDTMQSVMGQIFRKYADSADGQQGTIENMGELQTFCSIFPNMGKIPAIYIMTNKKGMNGFATILYPGALKSAADMIGTDLYVMPSSVHEAVLIPAGCFMTASELSGMVREVNATCVAEEEVVSDSIYFYDRKERKLCMAGEEGLCVRL